MHAVTGSHTPLKYDDHLMVTPHRRQHSDVTNQSYSKPLSAGIGSDSLAELHLPGQQGRRSMDSAVQGLHPAALAGHYSAALSEQGLHHTALSGHTQNTSLNAQAPSAESPLTGHLLPWNASGIPTPMIQDYPGSFNTVHDHSLHHQSMHNDSMQDGPNYDPLHSSHFSGETSQESLSCRANFFYQDTLPVQDTLAAQGNVQFPLSFATPPQQDHYPPSHIRSLSQLLAQSQSHVQPESHGQPPEHAQQQRLSHAQQHGQSRAQSHAIRHDQGQADALEYLRRSTIGSPPTWQAPRLPDLEAAAADGQGPTTQPQSEAAFLSW